MEEDERGGRREGWTDRRKERKWRGCISEVQMGQIFAPPKPFFWGRTTEILRLGCGNPEQVR